MWSPTLFARDYGGAGRGRKLIGKNSVNLIVGWCGRFLFFVVLRQFSLKTLASGQKIKLIPDWIY